MRRSLSHNDMLWHSNSLNPHTQFLYFFYCSIIQLAELILLEKRACNWDIGWSRVGQISVKINELIKQTHNKASGVLASKLRHKILGIVYQKLRAKLERPRKIIIMSSDLQQSPLCSSFVIKVSLKKTWSFFLSLCCIHIQYVLQFNDIKKP